MAIVRVQLARALASPPLVGKWNIYSGAWFQTATTTPTTNVKTALRHMFLGLSYTNGGTGADRWTQPAMFNQANNAAILKVWERVAGVDTLVGAFPNTIETVAVTGPIHFLPSQCQVAVGYRSATTAVQQRGRSRFFIGPLAISQNKLDEQYGRGRFLNPAGVDQVVSNVYSNVLALLGFGWTLMVGTTLSGTTTFHPAEEIYVDDVFDVQRSRRAWQNYQKRQII